MTSPKSLRVNLDAIDYIDDWFNSYHVIKYSVMSCLRMSSLGHALMYA